MCLVPAAAVRQCTAAQQSRVPACSVQRCATKGDLVCYVSQIFCPSKCHSSLCVDREGSVPGRRAVCSFSWSDGTLAASDLGLMLISDNRSNEKTNRGMPNKNLAKVRLEAAAIKRGQYE